MELGGRAVLVLLAIAASACTIDNPDYAPTRLTSEDLARTEQPDAAMAPDVATTRDLSPAITDLVVEDFAQIDIALVPPDLSTLPVDLAMAEDFAEPPPTPDLAEPPDVAAPLDFSPYADLALPVDLAAPIDLSTVPDLAASPDLLVPLDLSPPADLARPPDLATMPDLRRICPAGYGDCDGNAANGCETNLSTDPANCGGCDYSCSAPHASTSCNFSICRIALCSAGWADCNRLASDGCEVDITSDANNCGGCGVQCASTAFPNATCLCSGGVFVLGPCNAGYSNCDGDPWNGCETPRPSCR